VSFLNETQHAERLVRLSITTMQRALTEFRLAEFVNAGDGYSIVTVCSVFLKIIYYLFIWKEVVREDCQARKLNKEDAMDRCKWRKMIKEAR